jgi:methylglutamate dehydrogenase subunit C
VSGQSLRLKSGGLVDRKRPVRFTFDGRSFEAFAGDTLASALLANGVHLAARSFKYHRPRGIYTCGPEEPNALVTLGTGGRTEPNVPATTVEVFDGLVARSQNRWPSLAIDVMAVNSLLKPLFPAGFYYKTFMWPRGFWYRVYEPAIRRAAGLGTIADEPDPDRYEHVHAHCDVLVVGAGPAGLMAALAAARAGADVLLADERAMPGGYLTGESLDLDGEPAAAWARRVWDDLAAMPNVRLLPRTTVFGRYDGLTFGAAERVGDHLRAAGHGSLRQRRWTICARQFICATGAIERPLVFAGNDRPGVMLAGGARAFVNRYGVLPGRRAVVFTNNDDAYRTARDLADCGADVIVVDSRPAAQGRESSLPAGVVAIHGAGITQTKGNLRVRSVTVAPLSGGGARTELDCDLVCVSGGFNPCVHLLSHVGRRPSWDDAIASYVLKAPGEDVFAVGGAAGTFALRECSREGTLAGQAAARACGASGASGASEANEPALPPTDASPAYRITPLWRVPEDLSEPANAFVDLQNDVTVSDLMLAAREGFAHAEHAKRYTTLGMATDQGKLANVNALGILSELRGAAVGEGGTTTFRPLYSPVALGTLAGQRRGVALRPTRLSAMHPWHERSGAAFTQAGLWLRPYYYPRAGESFAAAVAREVRTVRTGVGIVDVSTLGKIELKGPDAGALLDRLYINGLSGMPAGRARYGVMLREDGMVFDDGTVSRLGEEHFFITVTTAKASEVLEHMEFCHQVHWPELDVQFCSVSDSWAAMAVAGPKSRAVLARVAEGLDLSNDAFPRQAAAEARIGGVRVRVLRISFSGELAYEIYAPAGFGLGVWEAIIEAGEADGIAAYGTEAMAVMRTEKGHVAGAELDGRTTASDLGLSRMMSEKKDYIGRWLADREGLVGGGRHELVGLRPIRHDGTFRAGAHLVESPGATGPEASQGHVTTAVYSPECAAWIGLALLKDGRRRLGERLYAVSPLHGEQAEIEITEPVFVDAPGERPRA